MTYTKMIKDMHARVKTRVRTMEEDLEHLPVLMGVTMDWPLVHFYFHGNGYLTRQIPCEVPWCIIFVDDIVLVDETRGSINAMLRFGDKR